MMQQMWCVQMCASEVDRVAISAQNTHSRRTFEIQFEFAIESKLGSESESEGDQEREPARINVSSN